MDRQAGHAGRAGPCLHGPGAEPQPGSPVRIGGCVVIRFAWLQLRMQAALTAGALTIVAVVLALTGPGLAHLYDTTVASCAARARCPGGHDQLHRHRRPAAGVPGLSPPRRPLAHRHVLGRTACFQGIRGRDLPPGVDPGVTRSRWLAVKLGLGAVASAAIAGLLSLMVSWWSSQLDYVNASPFDSLRFGLATSSRSATPPSPSRSGSPPGCSSGGCYLRCWPVVGFVAAREVVTAWVRPHLFTPLHLGLPITTATPVSIDQTSPGVIEAFESVRGISLPNAWVDWSTSSTRPAISPRHPSSAERVRWATTVR